jgi:hypothetical protein
MKMLIGDIITKMGNPAVGNESLHEISKGNGSE